MWWWGVLTTVVITALGYMSVMIAATLAGTATQLRWHPELSSFFSEQAVWQAASEMTLTQLIADIFALTASSLVVAGLTQTLIAVYTHRTIWGMVSVLTLALIAWLAGLGNSVQSWQQWLPGTQSMLSRHWPFEPHLPGFTVGASLAYNTVFALCLALAGLWLLRAFDFHGSHDDDE